VHGALILFGRKGTTVQNENAEKELALQGTSWFKSGEGCHLESFIPVADNYAHVRKQMSCLGALAED